jgi:hypothetical protein
MPHVSRTTGRASETMERELNQVRIAPSPNQGFNRQDASVATCLTSNQPYDRMSVLIKVARPILRDQRGLLAWGGPFLSYAGIWVTP